MPGEYPSSRTNMKLQNWKNTGLLVLLRLSDHLLPFLLDSFYLPGFPSCPIPCQVSANKIWTKQLTIWESNRRTSDKARPFGLEFGSVPWRVEWERTHIEKIALGKTGSKNYLQCDKDFSGFCGRLWWDKNEWRLNHDKSRAEFGIDRRRFIFRIPVKVASEIRIYKPFGCQPISGLFLVERCTIQDPTHYGSGKGFSTFSKSGKRVPRPHRPNTTLRCPWNLTTYWLYGLTML